MRACFGVALVFIGVLTAFIGDLASHMGCCMGLQKSVTAITFVALGTSLPELSTTIVAAFHRSAGVALGNVIGSNALNILAILGATALIREIPIDATLLGYDAWVMLGSSALLTGLVVRGATMRRGTGLVMLVAYLAYVASLYAPS